MDFILNFIERSGFSGHIFLTPHFRGPWGVYNERGSEVIFHLLLHGTCHMNMGKTKSKSFETMLPGDIAIFPRGDSHTLFDHPESEILSPEQLLARAEVNPPDLKYGGKGAKAHFVCGSFSLSAIGSKLLLNSMPKKIFIQASDRSDPQMEQILKMLAIEHTEKRIGYQLIINGLLKILFVCILRHTQRHLKKGDRGLLQALQFPHLATALMEIHSNFHSDWDLNKLSAKAGISRAKFAKDFAGVVGYTPARYLNLIRMNEAEALLKNSDYSVKEIGHRVGYGSTEVFIRNFDKQFGCSPNSFRKRKAK